MCRIIQLIILFVTVNFNLVKSSLDEEWISFKENYHKEYSSRDAEDRHYSAFKENLQEIERHNKLHQDGQVSYRKGITKFADLRDDEFTTTYGLARLPLHIYNETIDAKESSTNSSEQLDWRKKGAVTRVKDQGTCGSCWIFSAVGMLEGYHYRKTKKLESFSEQQMVDCVTNSSCSGGWAYSVFDYLLEHNNTINREKDYPYKGADGLCIIRKSLAVFVDFKKYVWIDPNDDAIKEAVTNNGPVAVALYANENWKLYTSGVWYEQKCSLFTNHVVLLIGYGRENGYDYWLLKNSWGKDWGENGYIKFIRNKHKHYCALQDYAFYLK